MKPIQIKSVGMVGMLPVPETVDEFDKNAKKVGACLDEATKNVLYRGVLNYVRDTFLHGMVEVKDGDKVVQPAFAGVDTTFNIERDSKKVTRGDKEVDIWETEETYINRVRAQLIKSGKAKDEAGVNALLQPLFEKAIVLCPFDASATERKSGPAKLAQKWISSASDFLTGAKTSKGATYSLPKLLAAIKKDINKEFVKSGDKDKDATTLGWLIKERDDKLNEIAKAQRDEALAG